jgi:hypothetical protein
MGLISDWEDPASSQPFAQGLAVVALVGDEFG